MPKSKGVAYKLADGTVKAKGRGRPPIGSILIAADGTELGLPVASKAKPAAKQPTLVLKPTGEIVARGKGKPSPRDIVVSSDYKLPPDFKPVCVLPKENKIETLAETVASALRYVPQNIEQANRLIYMAKTWGDGLIAASKFVVIE